MEPSWPEWTVSRLVIADRQGRARIVLGIEADGEPAIRMVDDSGTELARLGLSTVRNPPSATREVVAELRLGRIDLGAMIVVQASPGGEAFAELASSPEEDAAAVVFQVEQDRARVEVQDSENGYLVEVQGGIVTRMEGGGRSPD